MLNSLSILDHSAKNLPFISCMNVSGGVKSDPFNLRVQGQIGGNDLSALNGGLVVTADLPFPGGCILSPTVTVDTFGKVCNGGILFRYPFH